jgi:hypothetical protein
MGWPTYGLLIQEIQPVNIHGFALGLLRFMSWPTQDLPRFMTKLAKISIAVHIKPSNDSPMHSLLMVHGLDNPRARHKMGLELFQSAYIWPNSTIKAQHSKRIAHLGITHVKS